MIITKFGIRISEKLKNWGIQNFIIDFTIFREFQMFEDIL